MDKIKFDNMNRDWKWVILIVLSLVLILVGLIEPIQFNNPKIYKLISALGFLLQTIYFSRSLWYTNYVQWNKLGINIKINSFLGKSLRFDEIKSVKFEGSNLEVTLYQGKRNIEFDLSKIEPKDRQLLDDILQKGIN